MFYIPLSNFPWARDRACFVTREGRAKKGGFSSRLLSFFAQPGAKNVVRPDICTLFEEKEQRSSSYSVDTLDWPRDEKIWSLRRGKAPLVRGGRSCPEEQQGSPLLSSFLFPFLSRTELPFHRVSIFPIQPRSPANVNSVGKVGRARAIACRASLSPTGFSYSARRSARPEFFQAPQRGWCPVFVPPPL